MHLKVLYREEELKLFFKQRSSVRRPPEHLPGGEDGWNPDEDYPMDETDVACGLWFPFVGKVLEEAGQKLSSVRKTGDIIRKHRRPVCQCRVCELKVWDFMQPRSWYPFEPRTSWTEFVNTLSNV